MDGKNEPRPAHPDPFEIAPIARRVWDQKYRLHSPLGVPVDATLDETWGRIARAAAAVEPGETTARARLEQRFHDAIADFGFLPAGRIIAGAGSGRRVTLFNCFVMGQVEDDLPSIFDNLKEAALTMQQGGGIGHDFSMLRPKGALVHSIGADASGPVSFMEVWDAMCRTIMSAGARRGAMMGTLRCDHPDIEDFIAAKADSHRLRNFNLSVLVTDAFVAAVRAGSPWDLVFGGKVYRTVDARNLWRRIMRATYEYAEPGVVFIDRINAWNNLAYCEKISATNPCVTGETWVHTSAGPRQVRDLVGRPTTILLDGQEHASAPQGFFATARKPVVRIETEEGYSLRLTADHRLRCVTRLTRWSLETEWRTAGELRPGDRLILNDHRHATQWPGELSEAEGYLLGLLVGDGTSNADNAVLSVWWPAAVANGEPAGPPPGVLSVMDAAMRAAKEMPHRSDFQGWVRVGGRNEYRLALGALRSLASRVGMRPREKRITGEIERASSAFYRGFLRGVFDAEGSVQGTHGKGISVRLAQSDLGRLQAVQRMLLRLGIVATIYSSRREAGLLHLPDGRGELARYPTVARHELVISCDNLSRFQEVIGFADSDKADKLARAIAGYRREMSKERFTARVSAVSPDGEDDVFDIEVPGINAFDANGFHAHNCGEQPLPAYGACLLGSINLARLVERPFGPDAGIDAARLEERVRIAVRLLDDMIDVSGYPLEAQRAEAMAKRRIGLGVTGLADALIFCGLRYGSAEALARAEAWMAAVQRAAYFASAELAAEKGAFPLYDADRFQARPNVARLDDDVKSAIRRHGIRNGCLTSIAPTGTISLLAGNISSGIEPVFDLAYTRRVLGPDGSAHEERVEDYAFALHRRLGGRPEPLPDTFVTAGELAPRDHLAMQAALQRHVDSAISKTINCPVSMSFEAFEGVYLEAFDLGLKGCTTFRPNAVTGSVLAMTEPAARACPRCGATRLVRVEGCWLCRECGLAQCG
jgi:ribonucleoside-diphosphate reductase alpha chain